MLEEEGVTQTDLMKMAITFSIAMFGLPWGTSIESTRFAIFAQNKKTQKSWLFLQHLPICYSTCCGPICRRCCGKRQMSMDDPMNRTTSPTSGGSSAMAFLFLVIAQCDPAPTQLTDVIRCQCKALGKSAALTPACGCHKQHMSCTS